MTQLGWLADRVSVVCDIYESNVLSLRNRLDDSRIALPPCSTVEPILPKLKGIKCSLMNHEIPTNQREWRIDFTSAISYYKVVFIVSLCVGSDQ